NHTSPLDIPALLIAIPDLRFVMAADLLSGSFLAVAGRCLGLEAVDRRRPTTGARQLARLAGRFGNGPLAIFPEGGIVPARQGSRFHAGAFSLAIAAGAVVVPVAIHRAAERLAPRARLRVVPGPVLVEILDPIPVGGLGRGVRRHLRDQAEEAIQCPRDGTSAAASSGV
ncbi:MAG: lysophospholipid acyltransferase family protein, partial [Solirubrobacteraceae bacterium]